MTKEKLLRGLVVVKGEPFTFLLSLRPRQVWVRRERAVRDPGNERTRDRANLGIFTRDDSHGRMLRPK